MSDNYINYSNAQAIFGEYASAINKIKATPITYAAYQQLSAEEKAANRYLITDYPDEGDSYSNLTNKPKINNVTLAGNKSAHDLGLVAEESGKGLSSNDYTTAEKVKLSELENYDDTQLAGRVSNIEGIIPNDATTLNKLATADDIPDTTNFIEKSVTTGLVKNDGTIDTHTYAQSSDLGTAAGKDYTDRVSPNNRALVESQSVYSAIQTAVSSIYTPRGDLTCAELTSALLVSDNIGSVYEMTDAGTTSALFLQGAGVPITVGANVGVINAGEGRILFNLMPGAFDLSDYQSKELDDPLTIGGVSRTEVEPALGALNTAKADKSEMSVTAGTGADADKTIIQLKSGTTATVLHEHQDISGKVDKSATAGLLKNDGTVDTNTYITASDIAGKADKSEMSIVDGSGASADKTTITLKSGTSATVLKEHQDISGKAEKSEMSVTPGTGANADKTTIQLKEGTSATVLTAHQSLDAKADKILVATNNNLVAMDANGNIKDSGKSASDFATPSDIQNVYEVMGKNGAKNLLVYPYSETTKTSGSLTFTDNKDCSITVNGTAGDTAVWFWFLLNGDIKAGNYIYSNVTALPENTRMSVIHYTTPEVYLANISAGEKAKSFSVDNDISGIIRIGFRVAPNATITNYVVKPMIRYASDTDDTYQPYAETNKQLTEDARAFHENVNVLGAKNLIPYPYDIDAHMEYDGVVWDTVKEGTVTVTGQLQTANTTTYHIMARSNSRFRKSGTYILTGCPAGGSSTTYRMQAGYTDSGGTWHNLAVDYGDGVTFTYDYDTVQADLAIRCQILSASYVANNLTFHPMLRLATDTDDTWVPYAMTNQQMTPYVQAISNPNLLDNPWFTVNQRGNTFYQTADSYTVDRWILGKGAFTARETNKPYVVLQTTTAGQNGWIRQKTDFELDTTKLITYSAIIDAQVTSEYGVALKFSNMNDYEESQMKWFPTTANTKVLISLTAPPFKNTAFEVVANTGANSTVKIYALKAELGTVSTLAMDCEPNYASELLKCQRYFQRVSSNSANIAYALINSTTSFRTIMYLPCGMRATPSVTYSGVSIVSVKNEATITVAAGALSVQSLKGNSICFVIDYSTGGLTAGDIRLLQTVTNGYIDLSADL